MDATPAFLNRSEAAHLLHTLFDEQVQLGHIENHHPDFYTLLAENQRNPRSPSAIRAGYRRGNRLKYSRIDFIRISRRVMFTRTALKEWFERHYLPTIKKAA